MNKNKEFLEFVTSREVPPRSLSGMVIKDTKMSFHQNFIAGKFLFFQVLGALFSMSICPQFGLGLVEGHGITHSFRMIGDWACAAFCASVFFSSGAVMAFIGMKGEELWWIWRHYTLSLVLLPALLWGVLMMGNVSLDLYSESMNYHLVWILTAMFAQIIWMRLRMKFLQPSNA
jgi:hypothetical protein